MSIVAIIPARSGSKRIPKKNIKEFNGKPIIAYSIESAINSKVFDRVIVSTDCEEISKTAKAYGADAPFLRPKNLSNDYAETIPVIAHAIDWISNNYENVDICCCIYPTAPLLDSNTIVDSFNYFIETRPSGFLFSATKYSYPIQRSFRLNESGFVKMLEPENYHKRSQDLANTYHDAGQFYWGFAQSFLSGKILFSEDSRIFEINNIKSQDIDNLDDWNLAKIKHKHLQNKIK